MVRAPVHGPPVKVVVSFLDGLTAPLPQSAVLTAVPNSSTIQGSWLRMVASGVTIATEIRFRQAVYRRAICKLLVTTSNLCRPPEVSL